MPKPLRDPQPTSSVARLLDLGAAARALARKLPVDESVTPPGLVEPASPVEGFGSFRPAHAPYSKRELVLTRPADEALTRLVDVYRHATGTRLTTSHVARAILNGVAHCMDQLEKHAKRLGPLRLPSNARGKVLERERFEARIADAFIEGIRASSSLNQER
jgi:hypothetical protein